MVEYKYDAWGNHEAEVASEDYVALAEINPFRYRGYYFDEETGLYYLQTRYYDPEVGRFISRDSIEYADPEIICGLNLYAYCGNNPVMNVDPMGNAWWDWLLSIGQIIVGGILIITGVGAGFGAAMVAGGAIGLVTNIVGSTIGGGIGSMLNGYGAISTGLSLFSFGVPGIIAGVGLIAVGGATMAMGANEVVSGITGTNYLRNLMGEEVYDGLYIGLNIASSIGTIAGRLGMRAAGTYDGKVKGTAKPYARITDGYKTVQYNGRGKIYWSIHRTNHSKASISNPHWHTGAGRDGNHFNSYIYCIVMCFFTFSGI